VDLDRAVDDLLRHVRSHHLIIAISARALVPAVSIMWARAGSKPAWSISMRDSAIQWRVTPWSGGAAERGAADGAFAHVFERALGRRDRPHAMMDAPGAEPPLRDLEAAASPSRMFSAAPGRFEHDFGMAVGRVVVAEQAERAHDLHAGRVERTRIMDWRRCGSASGSVMPMTMAILQRLSIAPDVHHLRPLTT